MRKMFSGTVYYDPDRAFSGYTLWAHLPNPMVGADKPGDCPGEANLMDMRGNIVRQWKLPFPPMHVELLADGHLLAGMRSTETDGTRPGLPPYTIGGVQGQLWEFDWEGNVVFRHKDLRMHHDFKKLPNGNYMYLIWEKLPLDFTKEILGGIKERAFADGTMFSDSIVEVTPNGEEVWKWEGAKHFDPALDILGPLHPRLEWTHCNTLWLTEEGDIMSSARFCDMAFKIERKTGKIIWRWGQVAYMDKDTGRIEVRCNQKTLGGQHDVHIIPKGLPGAGHMLCYDNGMYKAISRAVEVDMQTGEVVWESNSHPMPQGRMDFSSYISSARRLPNGNTLLCHGQGGYLNEVTPDKEIVWEYYNPAPNSVTHNWPIFRCYRYAADFCVQFASLPPASGCF